MIMAAVTTRCLCILDDSKKSIRARFDAGQKYKWFILSDHFLEGSGRPVNIGVGCV